MYAISNWFLRRYVSLAGTLIQTPNGEVPIESLQPGDLVLTSHGEAPVKFIARSTRMTKTLKALGKMPIKVSASALEQGVPSRDTWLSPSHAVFLDEHLIEAAALLNDTTIIQDLSYANPLLTFYNIELEDHSLIWANGLPVETYFSSYRREGFSRDTWDNYADYIDLYGSSELMQEMEYPRIPFARQIPAGTQQRLKARDSHLTLAA